MFTELGKIWTQNYRKTEPTDTHEYIREHTRDQQKSPKHQKRDQSEIFDTEDHTEVSVAALAAFLQSVLDNHPNENEKPSLHDAAKEIQTPKAHKRKASEARRGALSAYKHAAETIESNKSYEITEEQGASLNLSDNDIQDIRTIVQGLKTLKSYNILTIEISTGDSFLNSLKAAVEHALNPGETQ